MRLIIFSFLLYCSTAALAHSLTDNPDALANRLHVLLSSHHLPMMLLIAVVIAIAASASVAKNRPT